MKIEEENERQGGRKGETRKGIIDETGWMNLMLLVVYKG